MRSERGITLIEMLIAMVIFLIVLAGAMSAIGAQNRGFNKGLEEMGILQNLRYGVQQMEQEIRMAGANTPAGQPELVYAGVNAFSFNSDLISNVVGDISAVYIDPDAPAGHVTAMTTAMAAAVPGSSPAWTYPSANFLLSPSETTTFWFTPDAATTRTDDFVLMRQVNDRVPEPLVRAILAPAGGAPFFSYRYLNVPAAGATTVAAVPAGWLPLRHTAAQHGIPADVGTAARIDSLRAVQVQYQVTNMQTGAAERIRAISAVIPMPNIGLRKLQSCGDVPIFLTGVLAVWNVATDNVDVTWNASVDEAAGEQDIIRYVIWRRAGAVVSWGDPIASIAPGSATYSFPDPDVVTGETYQYADRGPGLHPHALGPAPLQLGRGAMTHPPEDSDAPSHAGPQ